MLRAADRRTSPPPSHSPPPFRTPLVRDYNRLTSAAPAWIEPNTIDSRPLFFPGKDLSKFLELFEKYVKAPIRKKPGLLRKSGWE